jgi:plastocyanin
MSAGKSKQSQIRGRNIVAFGLSVGLLVGALSACSGGSNETASPTATSTTSTVATGSPTATETETDGDGQGSASGLASAVAAATSPTGAAPAPDAVLKISVAGRTVTPAPGRKTLSVGDRVRLIVTANTVNVLHVHGVEIEENVKPGVPLTVDFTVNDPGIYAVELHEPELLLVQLVVR